MNRITEVIQNLHQILHVLKPLLFEGVLFTWAAIEMGRFILAVAFGHEGGAQ